MKRRSTRTNPFKPRLSAGGANRTNLNGAMSRTRMPSIDDDCLLLPPPNRRPAGSSSDLMPVSRISSFRPFNSRLQPNYHHSPPRYLSQWQPPPQQNYIPPQYARREAYASEKRKTIPRKGMFQNAKYSAPPPVIDEDQIRHTEEVITRMIEKSRRKGHHDYHPPNFAMRDSIRQAVHNLGVPDNYRAHVNLQEEQYEEEEEDPEPSRRHHRQEFSKHSRHSRHSRGDRREDYEEEEEEFDNDDDEDESIFSPPKRKKSKEHRKKKHVEEYDDSEDEERIPHGSRKIGKQRRKRLEEKEGDTSDEESMILERSRGSNHSNTSRNSRTRAAPRMIEERPPSRGSKSDKPSRSNTPKPPSPLAGPYIKDPDDDDNWRSSLPFMCQPNGAGSVMLERIGSAITTLPLRDDTKNSYSEVAMMLLGKSLKKLRTPRDERDDNDEGLQSQLLNMSTCWARNESDNPRIPRQNRDGYRSVPLEDDDEVIPETQKCDTALMRDISRLQHPDNISTLQIDQSVFQIPRLIEVDRGLEEDWNRARKKPMPPPRLQSSPKSNDIFRTDEFGITEPSTIARKGPEDYGICISDDDDDPKQFDIDDYIARGASQLNFSSFPADPEISVWSNLLLGSKINNTECSTKTALALRNIECSSERNTTKDKSDSTSAELNSRFMSSPSRKRRRVDPILDVEESVQRIFDEVYKQNEEEQQQSDRQRYLF